MEEICKVSSRSVKGKYNTFTDIELKFWNIIKDMDTSPFLLGAKRKKETYLRWTVAVLLHDNLWILEMNLTKIKQINYTFYFFVFLGEEKGRIIYIWASDIIFLV